MADTSILVLNTGSGSISVVDPATDTVAATFEIGADPRDIVWAPALGNGFVSLSETGELAVFDLAARRVTARIKVGERPGHVYLNPDSSEIWVANDGSGDLTVVDAATGAVRATIPAGAGHHKIAFTGDGRRAFATNIIDATVTVVDAETYAATATLPVVKTPHGIAATPDGKHVLVCNNGAEAVSVIGVDSGTVIDEIRTEPRPNYIRIGPDRRHAFVAHKTGMLSKIDLDTLKPAGSVALGEVPERIVFDRAGRLAFVNDTQGREVTAIDTGSLEIVARVEVEASGWHQGMAFSPDGARLYAVNHGADSVSVLDAASPRVVKRIAVGKGPSNIILAGPG